MKLHSFAKILSFVVGASIALLGCLWIFIAASGALKTDPLAGYVPGAGFVLVAGPFLAFPFSVRVAKALLVFFMFVLAIGMLWFSFQPGLTATYPLLVQAGAIAFAVTLFARVGLALRRKPPVLGT